MKHLTLSLLAGAAALSMAGAVQAADLIIDEPAMSPGVVDVGGKWEGVFVGGFAGYASGQFYDPSNTYDIDGWLVGLTAGANFYLTDGVVAGVVGDVAWSGVAFEDAKSNEFGIDWSGSLRARLGVDAGMFMPYVTGGLAFAHGNIEGDGASHVGWTVGAGVEVALTDDLSLDALYRYSDYGKATYFGSDEIGVRTHQVTLGLNWKF